MKLVSALFAALLLATTSTAEAKPKAKASFSCEPIVVSIVGMPSLTSMEYSAAVSITCTNNTSKTVHVKAADVFLVDQDDDEYEPEAKRGNFDIIFSEDSNPPYFVAHFIDIAPGTTRVFGFLFRNTGFRKTGYVLDINGAKYAQPVTAQ